MSYKGARGEKAQISRRGWVYFKNTLIDYINTSGTL